MAALAPPLPVLVDEAVGEPFAEAIRSLNGMFTAPSGRRYGLALAGRRLEVHLLGLALGMRHPPEAAIEEDLLALAGAVYDRVGGEWSGALLRKLAAVWTTLPE